MTLRALINLSPAIHPSSLGLHLADAFFWSEGQRQMLRDEILEDADWAEVIDQLDVLLRKGRSE